MIYFSDSISVHGVRSVSVTENRIIREFILFGNYELYHPVSEIDAWILFSKHADDFPTLALTIHS